MQALRGRRALHGEIDGRMHDAAAAVTGPPANADAEVTACVLPV